MVDLQTRVDGTTFVVNDVTNQHGICSAAALGRVFTLVGCRTGATLAVPTVLDNVLGRGSGPEAGNASLATFEKWRDELTTSRMSAQEWKEFRSIHKEGGLKIDPAVAEIDFEHGELADPYRLGLEIPEEIQQIGRIYFCPFSRKRRLGMV